MPRNFGFEWTERNGKYLTRRHSRDGAFTSNSPVWSLGSKMNRLTDEMGQIVNTGIINFQVDVETPSVLSGFLSLKTRGKTWQRRWFALRSDFVLYSYRSNQGESRAMTATPVPGFAVTLVSGSSSLLADGASPSHLQTVVDQQASKSSAPNGDGGGMISERDRSFKMAHVHKSYQFQAATRQEAEK